MDGSDAIANDGRDEKILIMMMRRDKTRIDGLVFVAILVRLLSFRDSVFESRLRLFCFVDAGRWEVGLGWLREHRR